MLINGSYILRHNILNVEDLILNIMLLMSLPNMWDNDFDYQWTLVDIYHYYETYPYELEKNQQDSKWGRYKLVNHGYSLHGDGKSQGNILMYHNDNILESK